MTKPTYLFFGFAAEYILHPLFQHMQNEGHQCIEMDLYVMRNAMQTLRALKGKPVVFINSAHLFFDRVNFNYSYQYDGEMFSPLEVMNYLQPIKSIYIPHDLTDFFHPDELPWLDLFDKLLLPMPTFSYDYPSTQVKSVGWIKRNKSVAAQPSNPQPQIGFAMSEFEYYRRQGTEKMFATWGNILEQNIKLKLPHWKESDHFEHYLIKKNVSIFPSTANLSDFIDAHHVILANGLSSVNAEAAYAGRHVINIVDSARCDMIEMRKKLNHLPNIQFMTISECENYLRALQQNEVALPTPAAPLIKPFDFELAVNEILN